METVALSLDAMIENAEAAVDAIDDEFNGPQHMIVLSMALLMCARADNIQFKSVISGLQELQRVMVEIERGMGSTVN